MARARRSASRFRCGSASDEQRNLVFVVVHLATREQVLLPGAEGEFPHGVAENPRQVRRDEFQRINAKPIHTELGDDVLIGANEGHVGSLQTIFRHIAINSLQRIEIAVGLKPVAQCIASLSDQHIAAKLIGKDRCVER